ncbi:MAG: 50S ribosome-binding GTPase, partial [Myxococcota bacterium]|nr:50S ribosome-binding GTPase [Myxococcota bacterium]
MKPVVAIVGRPNVGKSSLFNRILGRTKALVEDIPGVTRDRNYAVAHYGDRAYVLVDTGGFEDDAVAPDERKALAQIVREAAAAAVEEADVIVVILDGQEGPNPADTELVERVRRSHKPAVYAINKIDHPRHVERSYE